MTKRNQGGAGGDELFRDLYGRYYARTLRFFRQAFKVSEEDAEDLTQDSFVRFYRSMREYRGEAEWGLLETIARNVGLNRVRSQSTFKRGARTESLDDSEAVHNAPAAAGTDPVERLIEAEQIARLHQAIAGLPKGQRQVLQLWLTGMRYDEIAPALRLSNDAVRSRLRDARRSLRDKLGAEADLPEEES